MGRIVLIVALLVVAGAAASVPWWLAHRHKTAQELVLYGNVDLRQVQLAFNNSERIAEVLVQEGDRVRKGDLVARLDTSRLEPQVAQAEAQVAAQRHNVEKLHAGNRPEEKSQARAIGRTRLMEPGEMSSPQKAVFSLAIVDPKWVRAYVSEVDLGKVRSGMTATIAVDSFPNRRFEGWIGFISPVAEFTPKTVQT